MNWNVSIVTISRWKQVINKVMKEELPDPKFPFWQPENLIKLLHPSSEREDSNGKRMVS